MSKSFGLIRRRFICVPWIGEVGKGLGIGIPHKKKHVGFDGFSAPVVDSSCL